MKRFGYAMGMQLLALVVYGLAVVDMLFYPDSDLRTIVGMILAARVIEAVAGMIAGSKRSQKFLENTLAQAILEKIERQDKLASRAEVSRNYNTVEGQITSLRSLVDATLNRQLRFEAGVTGVVNQAAEAVAAGDGRTRRRRRRALAEEG